VRFAGTEHQLIGYVSDATGYLPSLINKLVKNASLHVLLDYEEKDSMGKRVSNKRGRGRKTFARSFKKLSKYEPRQLKALRELLKKRKSN